MKSRYVFLPLAAAVVIAGVSAPVRAEDPVKLDTPEREYGYAQGALVGRRLITSLKKGKIDITAFAAGLAHALAGKVQLKDAELLAILKKGPPQLRAAREKKRLENEKYLAENAKKEGVKVTASGLQYSILKSGDAAGVSPKPTDTVEVHYEGTLISGKKFDSSYDRGKPATFPVNRVIAGWTEILQLMKPGDKWRVVIPSKLGYGARGAGASIGPNEVLLFDVELISIKK